MEKAKALLSEAGYGGGFETTISIDLGDATQSEPTAVLLQSSLAELGIKTGSKKSPAPISAMPCWKRTAPFTLPALADG